jgi:Flp pilus assembly protein TadG
MSNNLTMIASEASGATLPMVAMSLTTLFGFLALTVDLGYGHLTGQRLQATADSSALAAAEQLALTNSENGVARNYARLNMPAAEHGEVLASGDVKLGNWNAASKTFAASGTPANAVSVTTRRAVSNGNPLKTFFGGLIGFDQIEISRTAVAYFERASVNCILALQTSGTGIYTNASTIRTNGCSVHANSSSSNSMVNNSGGQIIAQNAEICTVGTVSGSGYSPAAKTRCAALADRLATLPMPTLPACTHTNKVVASGTMTLNPGRYCKGVELLAGSRVTFNPGTYIIEGDKFTVNAGAVATGSAVTFIMRDKNAPILINQDSRINVTAPATGTYAGVAFYVSRQITDYIKHEINSDSASFINGAIYIPTGQLYINSRGQLSGPGNCMSIITRDLYVNSGSSVFVDRDYAGCGLTPPMGPGKTVSLVN